MKPSFTPQEPVQVISHWYETIRWFMGKISLFPRRFKYDLGERISIQLFDVLERLIEAQYSKALRKQCLLAANMGLEKLRYWVRLAKDLICMDLKAYEHASRQIQTCGKMIGGWLKEVS